MSCFDNVYLQDLKKNKLQKLEDALVKQMLTAADRDDRADWSTGLTKLTKLTKLTGLTG